MDGYLTVAEVAKLAGVSYQAVYKRLSKGQFQGLVREFDGKKVLHRRVLNYFEEDKDKVGGNDTSESEARLGIELLERIVVKVVREQLREIKVQMGRLEGKIDSLIELQKQLSLQGEEGLKLDKEVEIQEVKIVDGKFMVEDDVDERRKKEKIKWKTFHPSNLDKLRK